MELINHFKNSHQKQSNFEYTCEFIKILNGLNVSIKEYYKVTANNIKEENSFLNLFENNFKSFELIIQEIFEQKDFNKLYEINLFIKKSLDIMQQLRLNTESNKKNLSLFFYDAKKYYSQMKIEHHKSVNKTKKDKKDYRKINIDIRSTTPINSNSSSVNNVSVPLYNLKKLNLNKKQPIQTINSFNVNSQNNVSLRNLNFFKTEYQYMNEKNKGLSNYRTTYANTENNLSSSYNNFLKNYNSGQKNENNNYIDSMRNKFINDLIDINKGVKMNFEQLVENLILKYRKMQNICENYILELEKKNKLIKKLNSDKIKITKENQKIKTEIEEKEKICSNLYKMIDDLNAEKNNLTNNLIQTNRNLYNNNANYNKTLYQKDSLIQKLKNDLEKCEKNVIISKNKTGNLEKEKTALLNQKNLLISKLNKVINNLNTTIEEENSIIKKFSPSKQNGQTTDDQNMQDSYLCEKQFTKNLLYLKYSSMEEENQQLKNKINELEYQLKNDSNMKETENNNNSTCNDIYYKEELEIFRSENRNLEYNINQLNNRLIELNESKSTLQAELNKQIEINQKNKTEIENLNKIIKQKKEIYKETSKKEISINTEEFDIKKMINDTQEKSNSENLKLDYEEFKYIKERFKELSKKNEKLIKLIKELLCEDNYNDKIKEKVKNICEVLDLQEEYISKMAINKGKNKKKKLFGFI